MLYYHPLIQALKDQTAVNTEHRTEASDLTVLTVSMYTRSVDVSDGLLFLTDVESKLYWIKLKIHQIAM